MPESFASRASAWLASRLETAAGVDIVYRRDAADCELTAVPGRRDSEDYGSDGAAVVSTQHDWIVDPTELVIDSETITPQLGDLIIHGDQTFIVVYGDGENVWRWTDQYRQRIRIHTVERSATGEDG